MPTDTGPFEGESDLREAVAAHVRDVHVRFAGEPPLPADVAAALERVQASGLAPDRVLDLARAGRLAEISGIRPLNLELDIVNKCNFRCVMCLMSHPVHQEQPLRQMPLATFEKLGEEVFWHVNALSLTYGAEPLLHPEFPRFLQIAQRYRIPRVYAVTNGSLLNEHVARSMVEHGMYSVVVSLDAAKASTYERIRIGGHWEALLANLRTLQRVKAEAGVRHPLLELAFVMMRSNVRELPAFVELGKELGASAIYALHMVPFTPLRTERETCFDIKETTNQALRAARETATRLGVNFTSPPEFGAVSAPDSAGEGMRRFGLPIGPATLARGGCPFPWHFAAIDMKGDVVPCGWWQGGAPMGNIYRESFSSIWASPAYETLRRQHRSHELSAICTRCPAAGVGSPDHAAAFEAR